MWISNLEIPVCLYNTALELSRSFVFHGDVDQWLPLSCNHGYVTEGMLSQTYAGRSADADFQLQETVVTIRQVSWKLLFVWFVWKL